MSAVPRAGSKAVGAIPEHLPMPRRMAICRLAVPAQATFAKGRAGRKGSVFRQ